MVSPVNANNIDNIQRIQNVYEEKQQKLKLVDRYFELSSTMNIPLSVPKAKGYNT
jgi:hypothetical protein